MTKKRAYRALWAKFIFISLKFHIFSSKKTAGNL